MLNIRHFTKYNVFGKVSYSATCLLDVVWLGMFGKVSYSTTCLFDVVWLCMFDPVFYSTTFFVGCSVVAVPQMVTPV